MALTTQLSAIPHPPAPLRQMIPHKLSQENNNPNMQLSHRKAVVFWIVDPGFSAGLSVRINGIVIIRRCCRYALTYSAVFVIKWLPKLTGKAAMM